MIDTTRIPPNVGIHEYVLSLADACWPEEAAPRSVPEYVREFPVDHSRREWLLYERATMRRAARLNLKLQVPVMVLLADIRRADPFWHEQLTAKLAKVFLTYEGFRDYDHSSEDHQRRCETLRAAKQAAGLDI